jgi:hypothetical protein
MGGDHDTLDIPLGSELCFSRQFRTGIQHSTRRRMTKAEPEEREGARG